MNYCVGDELFLSDKQSSVILQVVPHVSNRTNADLIRATGDEGLAEYFAKTFCHGYGQPQLLAWLQQPAPEVADEADS